MYCLRRISAFTLVELLVVLVIIGIMLVLSGGMSSRTRDTFISQQYIKSTVQNARILRRKSMLIARNAQDDKWVHAIGFRFEKNTEGEWIMKQIKVLGKSSGIGFYEEYPKNAACLQPVAPTSSCPLQWEKIDGTPEQPLIAKISLEANARFNETAPKDCTKSLTVLYESVNGNVHMYCRGNEGGPELPIEGTLVAYKDVDSMVAQVSLVYGVSTTDRYRFYLNLTKNGEIDAKKL